MLARNVVFGFLLVHVAAIEPNPPNWPSSVHVFGPEDEALANLQRTFEGQDGTTYPCSHAVDQVPGFALLHVTECI